MFNLEKSAENNIWESNDITVLYHSKCEKERHTSYAHTVCEDHGKVSLTDLNQQPRLIQAQHLRTPPLRRQKTQPTCEFWSHHFTRHQPILIFN